MSLQSQGTCANMNNAQAPGQWLICCCLSHHFKSPKYLLFWLISRSLWRRIDAGWIQRYLFSVDLASCSWWMGRSCPVYYLFPSRLVRSVLTAHTCWFLNFSVLSHDVAQQSLARGPTASSLGRFLILSSFCLRTSASPILPSSQC